MEGSRFGADSTASNKIARKFLNIESMHPQKFRKIFSWIITVNCADREVYVQRPKWLRKMCSNRGRYLNFIFHRRERKISRSRRASFITRRISRTRNTVFDARCGSEFSDLQHQRCFLARNLSDIYGHSAVLYSVARSEWQTSWNAVNKCRWCCGCNINSRDSVRPRNSALALSN